MLPIGNLIDTLKQFRVLQPPYLTSLYQKGTIMSTRFSVTSPIQNNVIYAKDYTTKEQAEQILQSAKRAQRNWQRMALSERKAKVSSAIDYLVSKRDAIATIITETMGRPISQSGGEVAGLEERARYMIDISDEALADVVPEEKTGFKRFIRKEALGTIFILAPWNFPFLTAINSIVPALVAGNTVILKHSSQTPQVAEVFQQAFENAGLPKGVFQTLFLSHADTSTILQSETVDFVVFTGSVKAGHEVHQALSQRFIGSGLELGGKDSAYVRVDADINNTAANLVDGSFFNSGQSCCGIERIYVNEAIYDEFVDEFVRVTKEYKLGNPSDPEINLGPMVRTSAADFVRRQISEAVSQGAKALIDEAWFPHSKPNTPYLAPQVLIDVNHDMRVMSEESFGPVIGIMAVKDDDEAIELMNDSQYGLTASIWTKDAKAAEAIANQLKTGTVFMNRCDYLDPALAWTGMKDTGSGISLSILGYAQLTRVKSYHFRID